MKKENEVTEKTIIEDEMNLVPCYMIEVNGEMNEVAYVGVDGTHDLGEKFSQYFDKYVVGDADNNNVLKKDTAISGDMKIVVMERHEVVIEFEEKILASDFNINELATNISVLSGIEASNILIEVESDEDGYIVRVIVIVLTDNDTNIIVKAVNEAIQDAGCSYGQLCRAKRAWRVGGGSTLSLSHGEHNFNHIHSCIILFLSMLMLMLMGRLE